MSDFVKKINWLVKKVRVLERSSSMTEAPTDNKTYGRKNAGWSEITSSGGGSMTPAAIKTAYESNADTNAYTDSEKTKLATIESSHFKGVHATLAALETAHPAASAEAGSYAYIKDGANPEKMAVLDGAAWKELDTSGGAPPLTSAQIKTMYESNADTNAYSDTDKAKVALIAGATGINFDEVILDGDRATNADIDDPAAAPSTLLRFVPISGLRHALTSFGTSYVKKDGTTEMAAAYVPTKDQHVATMKFVTPAVQIGDIHSFIAGKDLATKLMELKQQVDKNSHTGSTTPTNPVSSGIVPVYSEAAFEYIDIHNFIQNPAHPGDDISDGAEHYITVAVEAGKTLNSNSTWCWTKEGSVTPARMWTNAAKSSAVSPMELHAWINSGAIIKVVKTGPDWFVKDVFIPAGANTHSKALLADGSVKLDASYVPSDPKSILPKDFFSYDFVKIPNEITVAGTAWEDAMSLITPMRNPGVYELKWEILYTMNVVNKSAKFRYSIDNGATWAVLQREVKDKTNDNTIQIWFPYEITTAQVFKLKVQVAKEDAASVMKCKFGSLVAQRVR